MQAALGLAARGLGRTWPNPSVGCVILDAAGRVAGRGVTQEGGRPHAEAEALRAAGTAARGGTAYVTLEPCAHHGRTPPCAEALREAGIARCVIATLDPDPRVSGQGKALLEAAGIAVSMGCGEAAARELNAGFFLRLGEGRPLVTLKLATSLDGRIALGNGESRWITGAAARARGHLLRATYDAILIGSGTALADDPDLTCRLPGLEARSPVRIVLDRRLRLPMTARLVKGAKRVPTWLMTRPGHDVSAFRAAGLEVIESELADPLDVLRTLAERGLTRLLIEGGAAVATAFLKAGLVDHLAWFRSAAILGGAARPAIDALGLAGLATAPAFHLAERIDMPPDVFELYLRRD